MKTVTKFAFPALLLTLISCVQKPEFSDTPSIEFRGFEHTTTRKSDRLGNKQLRDSVVIAINFRDGDGDLGMTVDEFNGVNGNAKLKGVNNYEVRLMRKQGSSFVEVLPQVSFSSFFPMLKSDGKRGPIEGTLNFSQTFYDLTNGKARKDTLKFLIKIRDRALNESNTIESDTIHVFPPAYKR
ncbi:MAG: hypothetical protein LH606_20825 [Cytophagaceae bacterium]|nr:hypothetical protein [Cytophagaceae bacterium]